MTVNLEAQLRDYSGYVGSLSAPVELEEILHEPTGSEPMRPIRLGEPRRRPPRWVYGAAAAVATFELSSMNNPISSTPTSRVIRTCRQHI